MLDVAAITGLHRTTVRRWHQQEIDAPYEGFLELVCRQHEQNFRLWHEEDIARSPSVGDEKIADVKRAIDGFNQCRNDLIEKVDDVLIAMLVEAGNPAPVDARQHTETPGSVIDRLSIMSLRMFHMQEQIDREDADEEHRQKARAKLRLCQEQYADLSHSLELLLEDLVAGRARLKVYRQMKMYNDASLNPYLYDAKKSAA
jgi:uncharacterized protein DUF4254